MVLYLLAHLSINETTPTNTPVLTVTATDSDPNVSLHTLKTFQGILILNVRIYIIVFSDITIWTTEISFNRRWGFHSVLQY